MPVSPSSRCLSSSAELRRTIRLIAVSTLIIVLITPTAQSQQQQQQQTDQQQSKPEQPATNASLGRLLQEHCLVCHGDGGVTEGDIDLRALHRYSKQHAALPDDARLPLHPELPITVMQKVTRVLDLREMPPEDMEQPTKDLRQTAISELKHWLRQAAERQPAMTAPIRRMNRFQYHNAVQDLFRLKCIVFTMPERMMREHQSYFQPASGVMPDRVMVGSRPLGKSQMIEPRLAGVAPFPQDLRAEHGFDNQADHLSLSPLLMEAFLKLGQSITQSKDFTPRTVGIWNEFFASPKDGDEQRAIRLRLAPFLRRAFRQPIDEDTLNRYVTFVRQQRQGGASFTDAMKTVAAAAISSPRFLYLYASQTSDPNAGPDSFTVASRLSFFLWGSIPDDRLLNLAAEGRLLEEAVLVDELQRMLQDRKLKRFCDSFPSQWLQLERIISSVPNRQKFPQFYFSKYRDSMHMMLEPLLLFETVLIENQSAIQLIDPDFSYRSVLLDEAYGKLKVNLKAQQKKGGGAVTQLPFYRIPIEDRRTGGVITNAAVMTMTSGPERTQPITRGAWLATVIFNNPPEPPPADVPPLGEKPAAGEEQPDPARATGRSPRTL